MEEFDEIHKMTQEIHRNLRVSTWMMAGVLALLDVVFLQVMMK